MFLVVIKFKNLKKDFKKFNKEYYCDIENQLKEKRDRLFDI